MVRSSADFESWISGSDSELLSLNTQSNTLQQKVTPYFDLILFAYFASDFILTKVVCREMTEFEFSNGGRKCIRPILEAYQSGNR